MIVVGDSPTFLADPMITNIVAGMSNYLGVNGYSLRLKDGAFSNKEVVFDVTPRTGQSD